MTKALNVRHLRAHFRSFAVVLHLLGGETNHEGHEGHGEFRFVLSLCGTLAIWGARAASPQCSAACRAQNPVGKLPACAPRKQKTAHGTLRSIIDHATVVDCGGVDLRGLSSGADPSCRFRGAA